MKLARQAGAKVIYNPAPVRPIPAEAYPLVDLLVVNETEAEGLSGIAVADASDARRAAAELIARGAGGVLVTLGSKGSYYAEAGAQAEAVGLFTPARKVRAVDTTAAGDTFIGAFTAAAAEGRPAAEALAFATAASAITVTREGAQASIPRREEIEAALAAAAQEKKEPLA
jgi:ribokinase